MTSLKVLIVGEDNHSRTTIMDILSHEPSFEVIAQADTVVEAITYTYLMYPDLVFLQMGTPGLSAADVSNWIKRFAPGTKIVFLSRSVVAPADDIAPSSEPDSYISTGRLAQELPPFLEKFKGGQIGGSVLQSNVSQQGA